MKNAQTWMNLKWMSLKEAMCIRGVQKDKSGLGTCLSYHHQSLHHQSLALHMVPKICQE